MYEPITQERLDNYIDKVRELDYLLRQKEAIKERIGSLSGIDYSKIKVSSGNGNKVSEQERYVMALQKINTSIDEIRSLVIPEHEIIKTQIARVKKWNYRKVLILRYLEKWKWSEITEEFFGFEPDFEEQKYEKYKDTIMYWNKRALEELDKVSSKPYIRREHQLAFNLED